MTQPSSAQLVRRTTTLAIFAAAVAVVACMAQLVVGGSSALAADHPLARVAAGAPATRSCSMRQISSV